MKGKLTRLLGAGLALLYILGLASCKPKAEKLDFFAMDTYMQLQAYGKGAKEALQESKELLEALENSCSVTDPDSEIARLNAEGGGGVSEKTAALLQQALYYKAATQGDFDCTVASAVEAWGFYSREYRVPSSKEFEMLQESIGQDFVLESGKVTLQPGQKIDLGGIAKGYASDRIAELFNKKGISSALIVLGGSVHALGGKPDGSPWKVAIQKPQGGEVLGLWQGKDRAVVTSGDYQRFFEQEGVRYHHIIDPKTAAPAQSDLHSLTVICHNATMADAYSTALFVKGLKGAVAFWREKGDFDMVLYTKEGQLYITQGLTDSFSSTLPYEVLS